jgi:hypothetical protein
MTRERELRGQGWEGRENRGGGAGAGEETGLHEHTILLRQPAGRILGGCKVPGYARGGLISLRT